MSHVFRWDLDKTYLQTDFDSPIDLIKTVLQSAEDKRNIPGTAALMRELRFDRSGQKNRIHVVSGSPRQMRKVLERKLRLDGADIDSLTLKPNLGNLLKLRFRALRDQLGYKLPTLLESRVSLGVALGETCFGDDAEMDGIVYRLYADICAHRVRGPQLDAIITTARLYPDQADRIRAAATRLEAHDPVQRILIHLETGSPTNRFEPLGPRVAPSFNTFQSALVLHEDGQLSAQAVERIALEMQTDYAYTRARFQSSLEDALRRRIVSATQVAEVCATLNLHIGDTTVERLTTEPEVDYVALLDEVHTYQKARKASRGRKGLSALLGRDD